MTYFGGILAILWIAMTLLNLGLVLIALYKGDAVKAETFYLWMYFTAVVAVLHATKANMKQALQEEDDAEQIEEYNREVVALIEHIAPIKKGMDDNGRPLEGRAVELLKSAWPEQYRLGINRILGIQIVWK